MVAHLFHEPYTPGSIIEKQYLSKVTVTSGEQEFQGHSYRVDDKKRVEDEITLLGILDKTTS